MNFQNDTNRFSMLNETINTLIKNYDIQRLKKVLQGYYTFENNEIVINHSIENAENKGKFNDK